MHASVPPVITTSALPSRISRAASPIACALAAHAVAMHRFGPVQPNCIATVPAVAFVIIIGTKNGLTRVGPFSQVHRDLVLERDAARRCRCR